MRADTIIFFVSDYHSEDIDNMQSILPICIVGDRIIATSGTGIFVSHVWRQDYGAGLNVADAVGSQTRNYHFVDKRMFPNMILGNYWINANTSNPAQCGLHYSGDDYGTGIKYTGSSNVMLYSIIGDNSISAEGSLILHFVIIIALVLRIFLLYQ